MNFFALPAMASLAMLLMVDKILKKSYVNRTGVYYRPKKTP
jgi:hypothetical protein